MTIELRHLRCFAAIAEEGNLTRAAARLHLTQPALSRTLRQLEAHLGILLVDRSTHHLQLTEAGEVFRDKAAAALAVVDDALDPASAGTWPLRLGHAWSALGGYTTPLLRRWKQAYPQTPLQLLRIDDRTAGLTQGKVDIAILREPIIVPGVHSQQLLTETRMAAVPADSALAGRPSLTLADLADQTVALNLISGTTTPDLWPHSTGPTSTVTVANTDDWLATIAAGRAVGITSSATASFHPHPHCGLPPAHRRPGHHRPPRMAATTKPSGRPRPHRPRPRSRRNRLNRWQGTVIFNGVTPETEETPDD